MFETELLIVATIENPVDSRSSAREDKSNQPMLHDRIALRQGGFQETDLVNFLRKIVVSRGENCEPMHIIYLCLQSSSSPPSMRRS